MTHAKLTRDSFHVFQANAQNALKQMEDPQTTALWQEMCDAR